MEIMTKIKSIIKENGIKMEEEILILDLMIKETQVLIIIMERAILESIVIKETTMEKIMKGNIKEDIIIIMKEALIEEITQKEEIMDVV